MPNYSRPLTRAGVCTRLGVGEMPQRRDRPSTVRSVLDGLRAALWTADPSTASARDLRAYEEFARATNMHQGRLLALCLLAFNLLFWPTDLLVFRGQPDVLRTFAIERIAVTLVTGGFFFLAPRVAAMRRLPAESGAVVSTVLCFVLGHVMGFLGDLSSPWFHFTYLFVLAPLVMLLTLGRRAIITSAMGGAVLLGYFLADLRHLGEPLAPSACIHMVFFVGASVLLGVSSDRLRRRNYFLQAELGERARHLGSRVAEQTADMHTLTSNMDAALEHDRLRVAREVHDELGQDLAAMRFAVRVARNQQASESAGLPAQLDLLDELVARTTRAVRGILNDLRPPVLDELGLGAAIEWLARRAEDRGGIRCTADATGAEGAVPRAVSTAAFRFAQEALNNVLAHAGATCAEVVVERREAWLRLTVSDDGVGFDLEPSAAPTSGGMGLLGMRERARALGGQLWVERGSRGGTLLRLELPLAPPAVPPFPGRPDAVGAST